MEQVLADASPDGPGLGVVVIPLRATPAGDVACTGPRRPGYADAQPLVKLAGRCRGEEGLMTTGKGTICEAHGNAGDSQVAQVFLAEVWLRPEGDGIDDGVCYGEDALCRLGFVASLTLRLGLALGLSLVMPEAMHFLSGGRRAVCWVCWVCWVLLVPAESTRNEDHGHCDTLICLCVESE